jgi:serine/threonine protein kinase
MYLPQGIILNNRYEIESVLGHGGFGITYLAQDLTLNVHVAVKEYIPRQMATRSEGATKISVYTGEALEHFKYGLKKFLDEARAVAQFADHPNIVSARDYFEAHGTAYMVMRYVQGVDFKQYLAQNGGKIPFDLALKIMMPVMDALRKVHAAGLLHRDVSPDNIYLTIDGQVKLMDFGAARL